MISIEQLKKMREDSLKNMDLIDTENNVRIVVGMATCGISAGAKLVMTALNDEVRKRTLKNVQIVQTGCIGMCTYEPIVEVFTPDFSKVTYINVDPEKARQIVAEHIVNGNIVKDYIIGTANR